MCNINHLLRRRRRLLERLLRRLSSSSSSRERLRARLWCAPFVYNVFCMVRSVPIQHDTYTCVHGGLRHRRCHVFGRPHRCLPCCRHHLHHRCLHRHQHRLHCCHGQVHRRWVEGSGLRGHRLRRLRIVHRLCRGLVYMVRHGWVPSSRVPGAAPMALVGGSSKVTACGLDSRGTMQDPCC